MGPNSVSIENIDENTNHVSMELFLGVLEEKKSSDLNQNAMNCKNITDEFLGLSSAKLIGNKTKMFHLKEDEM